MWLSIFKYMAPVFFASLLLCYVLIRFPLSQLLDKASDRSLHTGVIPRSGGLAILLALVLGSFIFVNVLHGYFSYALIFAVLLVCVTSLADDFYSISPGLRLACQLLAVGIIVFVQQLYYQFENLLPLWLCQCLTALGLIWMINLYNFMDGMDGFASGMALIAFTTLAVLGQWGGDVSYVCLNMLLVFAVLGFWCFNFPPAKIFMGDTGSTLLGLLAGLFSLLGWQRELFPLWVPAILFSPFWIDATYTILKRMYRHEAFWLPHRTHLYQRLVLSGMGHKRVVLMEYLLMLLCALSVVLPLWAGLGYNLSIPLLWILAYTGGLPLLESKLLKVRSDKYS